MNELTEKLTRSLHDQRNILDENVQLEKALNEKNSSISATNNVLAEKERELDKFKQKLLELERQCNVKDTHSDAYEKQITALKNRISVLESSVESLQGERDSLVSKEKNLLHLLERRESRVVRTGPTSSEHINLNRVQGSTDLIGNTSGRDVPKNVIKEHELSNAVERFLKRTESKTVQKVAQHQSNSSDSISSKERVIEVNDYENNPSVNDKQNKGRYQVDARQTRRAPASSNVVTDHGKVSRRAQTPRKRSSSRTNKNVTQFPTKDMPGGQSFKFTEERLIKDEKRDLSSGVQGGYPHQISKNHLVNQIEHRKHHNHFHCCTLTHKIPSECNCVCVCLPYEYQLCCTEITEEYYVDHPMRCSAGQTSLVKESVPKILPVIGNFLFSIPSMFYL